MKSSYFEKTDVILLSTTASKEVTLVSNSKLASSKLAILLDLSTSFYGAYLLTKLTYEATKANSEEI